jgi:hypothetical protein
MEKCALMIGESLQNLDLRVYNKNELSFGSKIITRNRFLMKFSVLYNFL